MVLKSLIPLAVILTVSGGIQGDVEAEREKILSHYAVEDMRKVWDIEAGCLVEGATIELLEEAEETAELLPERNEHKENLIVIADAARKALTKPNLRLYGSSCRITFYCPGACCCGAYASGYTASGTRATANRTVACGDLPFGAHILIDGQEYIVEDRGVGAQQIDIFVNSHAEADARGLYYREVWIIE